jgi:hypothetical protein
LVVCYSFTIGKTQQRLTLLTVSDNIFMGDSKILTVFDSPETGDVITRDVRNYDFVLQVGETIKVIFGEETANTVVMSVSGTIVSLKVV